MIWYNKLPNQRDFLYIIPSIIYCFDKKVENAA